jgi:thymidylate synthase ThyX
MILQVFNRVNDVRDLCEKRCEQLRHLAKPIYRPVQRVHPFLFAQNESFNLIGTTTSILQQQTNEHFDIDSNVSSVSNNESIINHNAKMDKKQRYENGF